jgi:CheY-like chemotaxis protein
VAEDSAVNRRVCELMFSRLGHQVTFAVDGLEAVRLQESLDPDLIVMDLQMPHLDGFGATEQIRRHGADPGHPWIVALTAGGQPSDREQALAVGMNDFLTKPLRLEALRDALSRAEQARQGNQGASLKSGSRFSRKALRPS